MATPASWPSARRRTVLHLAGLVGSGGLLQEVSTATESQESTDTDGAESTDSFVLSTGDRCLELEPLSGDEPVEDLYDYTYPTDVYDGPPGSEGTSYSSEGTTDLQRDATSILFLYDGPQGLSLVVVHGRLDGDDGGGTVSFTFEGLPDDGAWVVRDDYYLRDGEPASSNNDRWDVAGTVHTVDWAYVGGRTDGGAFRGLDADSEVIIDPAFNDAAALADDFDFGPIESWEVLSGDRANPDRYTISRDDPVTIRYGSCSSEEEPDDEAPDETEESDQDAEEDDEQHEEEPESDGENETSDDEDEADDDDAGGGDESDGDDDIDDDDHESDEDDDSDSDDDDDESEGNDGDQPGDSPDDAPGRGPPDDNPGRGPPEDAPGRGPPDGSPGRGPPDDTPGRGPPDDTPGNGHGRGRRK